MHVKHLSRAKVESNWVALSRIKTPSMYGMGSSYALYCVLRMLEIFSRSREPEVEETIVLSFYDNPEIERFEGELPWALRRGWMPRLP